MSLSSIGPNMDIIKRPWNWFVVAFALITLGFLVNFVQGNNNG